MIRTLKSARSAWLIITLVLAIAAAAVVWKSTDEIFTRVVGYFTIFGSLIALYAAFKGNDNAGDIQQGEYDRVIGLLSERVTNAEGLQRRRLLDLANEPAPTRLRAATFLRSYRSGAQPHHADWHTAFHVFWGLKSRRLLLLGEPGAGKTLLLLELVKQAAEVRDAHSVPVLMRVNIAEWRSDQSFHGFFVEKVAEEQALSVDIVERLVGERRVIPLLDGLDELDPEGTPPIRGGSAIARLNSATSGSYPIDAPLVVTCRRSYFERLENLQAENNDRLGLVGAGCFVLERLNADQILTYLRANLSDEALGRWQSILNALKSVHPNLAESHIAVALASPWRLMLAFRAYANSGTPSDLLSEQNLLEIEARLLPQFLAVAMQWHGSRARNPRNSVELQQTWFKSVGSDRAKVAAWLKQIAIYLEKDREHGGGSGELVLYQIYRMVDKRLLRGAFGCCILLAAACILALITLTALSGAHPFPRVVATVGAVIFLIGGAQVAIFRPPDSPAGTSLTREIRTPGGLLDLGIAFFCAIAASVFTLGTSNALGARILGGSCCGFLAGLFFGFVHSRRVRARGVGMAGAHSPTDPLRGGLWDSSIIGLAVALVYGAVLFFSGAGIVQALTFSACTMLVLAPILGMPLVSVAWSRYRLATVILFVQRRLPWRLSTFLQWNYEAGLMRVSGLAYQFRHLRLQKWLAETSEDDLLPRR